MFKTQLLRVYVRAKDWSILCAAPSPCSVRRSPVFLIDVPIVDCSSGNGFCFVLFFWVTSYLCHFYLSQSLSLVVEALFIQFLGFFWRNYSTCICVFVVSPGGGEFRILLCCHLEQISFKDWQGRDICGRISDFILEHFVVVFHAYVNCQVIFLFIFVLGFNSKLKGLYIQFLY